jgi:UDP-2-acetamido-3-amino-2,3-dideoxy-glucuronate N-acetyltransferase
MEKEYFAHPTAVIDEGATIGKGTKIWHFCHIMPGAVIGERCSFGQNIVVADGATIGNNFKVQANVLICAEVHIGDDVFCGPGVSFTNITNPRSSVNRRGQYLKTHVGKGASIGANVTIVCGHDIGKFAFIGAGAVVTKEVPDYALVVGNPARQLGWMSEFGHRLHFDDHAEAVCPESGQKYKLQNGIVTNITEQG